MFNVLIALLAPFFIRITLLFSLSYFLERVCLAVGKFWYRITAYPGVIVHEAGHLLGCLLTLTRVHGVNLYYSRSDGTLGQVVHKKRNPVFDAIIGIMPFFVGGGVLYLSARYIFDNDLAKAIHDRPYNVDDFMKWETALLYMRELVLSFGRAGSDVLKSLDYRYIGTFAFLYMMISVGAHIRPSPEDRKGFTLTMFLALFVIGTTIELSRSFGFVSQDVVSWLDSCIRSLNFILDQGIVFTLIGLAINIMIFGLKVVLKWTAARWT